MVIQWFSFSSFNQVFKETPFELFLIMVANHFLFAACVAECKLNNILYSGYILLLRNNVENLSGAQLTRKWVFVSGLRVCCPVYMLLCPNVACTTLLYTFNALRWRFIYIRFVCDVFDWWSTPQTVIITNEQR